MKFSLLFAVAQAVIIRDDKDNAVYHSLSETLGTEEANEVINTTDYNDLAVIDTKKIETHYGNQAGLESLSAVLGDAEAKTVIDSQNN